VEQVVAFLEREGGLRAMASATAATVG